MSPRSLGEKELARQIGADQKDDSSPIQDLPSEIQLFIFDRLDVITSTCLGLTCKGFFYIHWKRHGVVNLRNLYWGIGRPVDTMSFGCTMALYKLMEKYTGPKRSGSG